MDSIVFRRFPRSIQVSPGAKTIVCTNPKFALRLEIPDGMFSQAVTLRFYKPFKPKKVPDGWDKCNSRVYEIRKYGVDANPGFKFLLEMPHGASTGDDVWCFEALDDSSAESWLQSDQQIGAHPDDAMGGRFELDNYKYFTNFKKEPTP